MKKNLKSCVELPEWEDPHCLLDMNQYEGLKSEGLRPDLRHNRSAHLSAAWHFAEHTRAFISLGGADLSVFRYLTFSVFSAQGAGGSFSLLFDQSENGEAKNCYEQTFHITHDGWNHYRVELPFMRCIGEPFGWDQIGSICWDHTFGGQSNRAETILYLDNLYAWEEMAPPLYGKLPELKGAAAFARNGKYALVDRKRIPNAIDFAEIGPFERDGVLWLPMAPVAAGIAHLAIADNIANTLSFTYRRKKYFFSADADFVTINGEKEALSFRPLAQNGVLFFPADYVRSFFHWRQIYVDPMGLIVLSNRRNVFENSRDESVILQLISDMTFHRPNGNKLLGDLRRRFPNPLRGRLLASHDELMQLRKSVKGDATLRQYAELLKAEYGKKSQLFLQSPIAEQETLGSEDLILSCDCLWAFSLLYRITGEKPYCERAYAEALALTKLESWEKPNMQMLGRISLAMAICYDWCHHMWSEGEKAKIERAMLRNGMRVGVDAYNGKKKMWHEGGTTACVVGAGMLAMALSLADIYPETALKLSDRALRNLEPCFLSYAPDGGCEEGVSAWELRTRSLALVVAMLQKACGSDYGLSLAPGWRSTAYFAIYMESANGAWNYHNCKNDAVDNSIFPFFSWLTKDPVPVWLRHQQLLNCQKRISVFDILFYEPMQEKLSPHLALDSVYRKAGLAVMRSDWSNSANLIGLHGGSNRVPNADLDAGSVLLEMEGERFFCETGGVEELPILLRRRAVGQNTLVIDPTEEPAPDQNPDAAAPLVEMRSDAERAYAIVDMTKTNDLLLRAKRGVLLTDHRSVAVVQDELTVAHPTEVVWSVWTRAEVQLNKSGRTAKLSQNGKTLLCKLGGIGSPARFEAETYEASGMTRLFVRVEVKERLRMFVACKILEEGEKTPQSIYESTPMSNWSK